MRAEWKMYVLLLGMKHDLFSVNQIQPPDDHKFLQVFPHFQVDFHNGLSANRVAEAQLRYGRNELAPEPGKSELWVYIALVPSVCNFDCPPICSLYSHVLRHLLPVSRHTLLEACSQAV